MQVDRPVGCHSDKVRKIAAAARIKPAAVQVESHPHLPEWELLDFCREHGIVLLAFAPLGHGLDPKLLEDPVITGIAQRLQKTPAQVALSWAVQRGTAFLTTSTKPHNIQANVEISALPEDAMREIRDGIKMSIRFNTVVGPACPASFRRLIERTRRTPAWNRAQKACAAGERSCRARQFVTDASTP